MEMPGQRADRRENPVGTSRFVGNRLLSIQCRFGPFFQRSPVPYPTVPRIAGELKILRQFQRIRRTRILAQPAKHAAAQIVGKVGEFFAAGLLIAFARNHNQIFWTSQRTQVARNTQSFIRIGIYI